LTVIPPVQVDLCEQCTENNCPVQLNDCDGPGATNPAGCNTVLDCVNVNFRSSSDASCANERSSICYCGSTDEGTCGALGDLANDAECDDIIINASGCNDGRNPALYPPCVFERFISPDFPLGDAVQVVECQRANCATVCGGMTP
jgi:hypothetical protein